MKKLIAGVSLVLVLGMAVAGTLALFSSSTQELKNEFTMGEGVDADIKEPAWDGVCFAGETNCNPAGSELGKDTAKGYAPGSVIAKNPQVKNTSKDMPIFAAVEIVYTGGATSKAALETFATVNFDTTKWEFNADYTVAYYKGTVAPGTKTEPVFTNVTINKDATEATIKNFEITVKGYAVQAEKDVTDYKATINSVFANLNK